MILGHRAPRLSLTGVRQAFLASVPPPLRVLRRQLLAHPLHPCAAQARARASSGFHSPQVACTSARGRATPAPAGVRSCRGAKGTVLRHAHARGPDSKQACRSAITKPGSYVRPTSVVPHPRGGPRAPASWRVDFAHPGSRRNTLGFSFYDPTGEMQ